VPSVRAAAPVNIVLRNICDLLDLAFQLMSARPSLVSVHGLPVAREITKRALNWR
jgi:hypothetical protein